MPNTKYIPALGGQYTRIPKIEIDYDRPNYADCKIIEAEAVQTVGGGAAEIKGISRSTLPFQIAPTDFATVRDIVNGDTDTDGTAAYPSTVLNAWGDAVKAGKFTIAMLQVMLMSECRHRQRARDEALATPPAPPAPEEPAPEEPTPESP